MDLSTRRRLRYQSERREAIALHRPLLPSLPACDRSLLKSLNQHGIAITSLSELQLPNTSEFLAAADEVTARLKLQQTDDREWEKGRRQKRVLQRNQFLLTASSSLVAAYPPLFTWGLQSRLLHLIEHYQQLSVAYHGVYLRRDRSLNVVTRSRLWHTDMEDDHTFKVIVYLHEVDEQGGAFQYLPKPMTQKVQQALGQTCGYIRPGKVESLIQPSDWHACTGGRGTVILVDTGSLIHRGTVPQRDRYTAFCDYTSRLPRRPYYCKSSLNPADLHRLAQELSPAQKDCIWWRSTSPGRGKAGRLKQVATETRQLLKC